MSEQEEITLDEIAIVNPPENLVKGAKAKKVNMDVLIPFTKRIPSYSFEEYIGGMKFRNGDILVARITPCLENGKTAYVDILDEGEVGFGSTEFIVLREKKGKSDKNFLYYFALSPDFRDVAILSMTGSSGRQRVQTDVVRNHPFLFPPLAEQRAIASVLSSLDDKIDLLHRENKTLEKMAEAIFRQWFIEDADEGWEEVPLGALFEISSGKGLKKEQFIENGIYPVLGANGLIGKTDNFLYDEKLIYTGRVGTLGNVFIIENEKVWLSDNTLVIRPHKYFYSVYFILKYSRLEEYNVGSTQPLIRQSDIKEIEFALPPEAVMNNFEIKADVLFSKIKANQRQIRTLERLRDTLLPKLMSGEVRIEYKTVK